ncbi:MAG: FTR1 family protein [Euryarchaeota archaeon]|nr:FTR1 family protein [Euryarchaeota archaeon]
MVSADATLIVLRESLEAFLIISILTGLVVKLGRPEMKRHLLMGAGAAALLSVVAGVLIDSTARDFFATSGSAEAFEGVASLVAVAILTYMVIWMYRHTIGLVTELRKKAVGAIDAGKPLVFFSIAFVAVAREGLETVLFFATLAPTISAADLLLSALIGLAISGIIAYLVFTGIVKLNINRFFAATGVLLILFAGGLFATAVHEFSEVGWVPESGKAWNTEGVLDQQSTEGSLVKAVLGYRESPTYLEAAAYFAYVLGMGAWYLRGIGFFPRGGKAAPDGGI